MNPRPEWLPPLVELADYNGNWKRYEEALYGFFRADFVDATARFRYLPVRLKRMPMYEGKEASYWHCISTGSTETDRVPDLRRCERIRWPRPCLEHETGLKVWMEKISGEDRIHLWLEAEGYLIVLAVRRGYVVLWTTFYVQYEHERRKFNRRYEAAQNN